MPVVKVIGESGEEILSIEVNPNFNIVIAGDKSKPRKRKSSDKVVIDLEEKKKELNKRVPETGPEPQSYHNMEETGSTKTEESSVEESLSSEIEGLVSEISNRKESVGAGESSGDIESLISNAADRAEKKGKLISEKMKEAQNKSGKEEKAKEILTEILDYKY